jgi:hypothetical protein
MYNTVSYVLNIFSDLQCDTSAKSTNKGIQTIKACKGFTKSCQLICEDVAGECFISNGDFLSILNFKIRWNYLWWKWSM